MIAAIVPAKALDEAKTRLAALLTEDERRRLALAMLKDVLQALQAVPPLDAIAVVSPDMVVLDRARELGAETFAEPSNIHGLNEALLHGLGLMAPRGLSELLVVLADVPTVSPTEIESVLDALPDGRGAVICPSMAAGTSALALRPPDVIPFRFGPESFDAHKQEAEARSLEMRVLAIESLARDIDEPDDLRYLLSHPTQTATHRLLGELRLDQRLAVKA